MGTIETASDRHRNNLAAAVGRLRGTMDAAALAHADRMARVHNAYVLTAREKPLSDAIDRMIGNVAGLGGTGDVASTGADKRRAIFVIGESGSGKTTAIRRQLSLRPQFQSYPDVHGREIFPMVSFDAPKPLTLKLLARKGLEESGYPVYGQKQENEMWDLFKEQIKERSVLFLHIDEMQHVIKGNRHADIQNIADVVKSLLQIKDWPVHAIFSGVPSLAKFLEHEKQLRNRCEIIKFEPMAFPSDVNLIRTVMLRIVTMHAELEAGSAMESDEFIHRLMHAADGAFGTIIQIIRAAVASVIYAAKETTVSADHFTTVYKAFTGCTPDQNIFTASNFLDIDPDAALSQLIEEYEQEEEAAREARKPK